MSKCSLRVESLEGLLVSEDYLRGYLEAFGVETDTIETEDGGHCSVICDRCYDILDRLTTMNADHQKPTHKGRKLRFQLVAGPTPPTQRQGEGARRPSKSLRVGGFTAGNVSEEDLASLFGLYGTVAILELITSEAIIEYSEQQAACAAQSALNGGFFRGCFLSVEFFEGPSGIAVAGPLVASANQATSKVVCDMSNTVGAEEFLARTRLSSPDSRTPSIALPTDAEASVCLALDVNDLHSPRVEISVSDEESDSRSVVTLDSTSASSILSTLDTDDSRFRGGQNADWSQNCTVGATKSGQPSAQGSVGGVLWLHPSSDEKVSPIEDLNTRSQLLQSLQERHGWTDLGSVGIVPGNIGLRDSVAYSDSDPLFESFLSFDPTLLDPLDSDSDGVVGNEGSALDFEPVVIDLADANMKDVKCAITGTSMSAAQYDRYLSMVNAYFAETSVAESTEEPISSPIGGRFVVRENSAKSVAFSDLSDDLVGVQLNHDTPAFVPKNQQRNGGKDADSGSVASAGFIRKIGKSTDPEDTSEGGDIDEYSNDVTKGEYSIHSGQYESDIRNIFVGNIGRLLSDGVQQLKSYFADMDITVLKVDIKISFAFLEVRNTPSLQSQIEAISIVSGGKPPPFGKDERLLRIEFVQQSSAGKRNIRLRREGQQSPISSLFIVGFDHRRTPTSLLNGIFSPFGPLEYVELKNNYAFVKFVEIGDAIKAQEKTHGMTIQDRTLSVEFSSRHLSGDKSVTSDGGDSDGRQGGSVGSKDNKSAGSGHRYEQAPIDARGTSSSSRSLSGRYEDDRVCSSRGRGGGGYPNKYGNGGSPPTVPRHHRMARGNGDRYSPHRHVDGGVGPLYRENIGLQPFPPPPRYEQVSSYSGYMPPYLSGAATPDYPRPYEQPYHAVPPSRHYVDGPDRWQSESNYKGGNSHPRGHTIGAYDQTSWPRHGGLPPGFNEASTLPPYNDGRYPPKPSSPGNRSAHFRSSSYS